MPFARMDGGRLDRIHLSQRAPGTFQLLEPFSYLEPGRPEEERIVIRAHDESQPAKGANASDLASIPPFLWGLISNHGRHTASALMHDQLWWECLDPDRRLWIERRREADRVFRVSLREGNSSAVRSAILWSAVSIERFWGPRRWQAIAMAVQIVLGVGAIYLGIAALLGLGDLPLMLATLVAAPALLALPWRRDAAPIEILTHLGILFLPIAVVAIVGQFALAGLEVAGWALGGRKGPAPRRGPVGLTRPVKVRARNRVRAAGD
ncbi:DUF1353 domain-containing protein [Naasia lichenicola]|uniref:DUF1353 domain-containing protein n=1 Tax=Naasia lichenicola TaxID=2565933 RepID=A0A4S4FPU7_9MICO|nr:DUF1353 domain-containing protein [Naasia lichenicola]THG32344.1 DUF1353 domain-containing protein [Naasia lichenicola]